MPSLCSGLLFGRVLLLLLAFFLISSKPDQFVRLEVVSLVFDLLARSLDTIRVRDRLYHVLSTLGDRYDTLTAPREGGQSDSGGCQSLM
jgi:hypothetical protein